MTEALHTPGPWVDQQGTSTGRVVIAPDQPKVRRNVAAVGGQNRDANARLIAAAPDLLEALLVARGVMEVAQTAVKVAGIRDAIDRAVAAIAQAEGRA